MIRFATFSIACAVISGALVSPASAIGILPFTEDFPAGVSNWAGSTATSMIYAAPGYQADGGPLGLGDGYITTPKTFSANPLGQIVFRGQGNFDSSGDAFVGDWIGRNVTDLSFWIRQASSTPLRVGVRFAVSANAPAGNIMFQTPIEPNVWTLVNIPISSTDTALYDYTQEGGSFEGVFRNIANVQILTMKESLPTNTVVTIDLDKISMVPEPSTLVLAGLGLGCMGLAMIRRRNAIAR